ncbi:MAG: undecaprenyl-diphosphate phosphatase [Clostridiales bacterium]|nr:undecaprenyl-diphosphate phosphatase [Clostridiales bacterium]
MKVWEMILLGFIQGMTEFLPVSSSGHLLIAQKLLGVSSDGYMFYNVMLHIGTLIPVCIIFFKDILGLFKKPFNKLWYLILATIPAGVMGIAFKVFNLEEMLFTSYIPLIICYLITAIVLLLAERTARTTAVYKPLNAKRALGMGLAQGIGVFPGISRSGITISGGTFLGLDRDTTASFSFLMSIPIILASALLEGYSAIKGDIIVDALPLICGVISSAVFGYIAIKFMLKLIKKANYKWFSLYIIILIITLVILECLGI